MKFSSLRFRLAGLILISIVIALTATDIALNARFTLYFENRINSELEQHLEQLASNLTLNDATEIEVAAMPDRRFAQPFSGLYWQVSVDQTQTLLSRSLWGKELAIPAVVIPGDRFRIDARSPTGSPILISGWTIILGEGAAEKQVVLAVAIDRAEVENAALGFRDYLLKWLAVMLAFLLLAAWVQVSIGLAPLKLIYRKVEEIKNGQQSRLSGWFPSEVQPLVDEVNTLLDAHETSLGAARARAGDLAHGLKTPLTVMRTLLHDLDANIDPQVKQEIQAQISSMHHFIERELARARLGDPLRQRTKVSPVLEQMVAAMKRLPQGTTLTWEIDIDADLRIPFDQHDLAELLGNILDNARKWAKTTIMINGVSTGENTGTISIEDDGSGVPADMLEQIIPRGKNNLSPQSGSGLGLAIASDLIKNAGGNLVLEPSEMGGLKVTLSW